MEVEKFQESPKITKNVETLFVKIFEKKLNYINQRKPHYHQTQIVDKTIDFNLMHFVSLCKKNWQKLQIRGSRDLQNSVLCIPGNNFGAPATWDSDMRFFENF